METCRTEHSNNGFANSTLIHSGGRADLIQMLFKVSSFLKRILILPQGLMFVEGSVPSHAEKPLYCSSGGIPGF